MAAKALQVKQLLKVLLQHSRSDAAKHSLLT
jgi:hypothetical protein